MTAPAKDQEGPEQPQPTEEERFRSSLADAIVIVKKLSPHCKSPQDMVGMMELALSNDGQLSVLWEQMNPVSFRR